MCRWSACMVWIHLIHIHNFILILSLAGLIKTVRCLQNEHTDLLNSSLIFGIYAYLFLCYLPHVAYLYAIPPMPPLVVGQFSAKPKHLFRIVTNCHKFLQWDWDLEKEEEWWWRKRWLSRNSLHRQPHKKQLIHLFFTPNMAARVQHSPNLLFPPLLLNPKHCKAKQDKVILWSQFPLHQL